MPFPIRTIQLPATHGGLKADGSCPSAGEEMASDTVARGRRKPELAPVAQRFWSDRRKNLKIFSGKIWQAGGRESRTAVPEALRMVEAGGVRVVGATRARPMPPARLEAPLVGFVFASGGRPGALPDEKVPRGVLRRPGEHAEGNLRKLMQVAAAGACASRGRVLSIRGGAGHGRFDRRQNPIAYSGRPFFSCAGGRANSDGVAHRSGT
jgi:hypothetical protein